MVMRLAGHDRHGLRLGGLIAVLWRGGLRISEALALTETDIDTTRGSLIRHGTGDKRREAGIDQFGFEQLAAWLTHASGCPSARCSASATARAAAAAGRRPPLALSCASSPRSRVSAAGSHRISAPRPRGRARAGGSGGQHHPTPARPHRPGDHLDLPAGHRSLRDHRRRPIPTPTNHLSHRGPHALTGPAARFPFDQLNPRSRSDRPATGAAALVAAVDVVDAWSVPRQKQCIGVAPAAAACRPMGRSELAPASTGSSLPRSSRVLWLTANGARIPSQPLVSLPVRKAGTGCSLRARWLGWRRCCGSASGFPAVRARGARASAVRPAAASRFLWRTR